MAKLKNMTFTVNVIDMSGSLDQRYQTALVSGDVYIEGLDNPISFKEYITPEVLVLSGVFDFVWEKIRERVVRMIEEQMK